MDDSNFAIILKKLEAIDALCQDCSKRLDDLDKRCTAIEDSTDRMDAHIDFITRTYMYLRSPLMAIRGVTNKLGSVFLSGENTPRPPHSITNGWSTQNEIGEVHENEINVDEDNELPLPPLDQYPKYKYNYMKKN